MPVKPTDTPPPWADAGNYVAPGEAWNGQPRLTTTNLTSFASTGSVPQQARHAGRWNEYLRRIRDLANWVYEGKNTAAEDAHVVETDANGQLNAARAIISGHTVAGPSCTIGASASGVSLSVTGPGGTTFGATISNAGSGEALRALQTGTGPALHGLALGTNNDGVQGTGAGTGRGVYGIGDNNASSRGVEGVAGHIDAIGVRGLVDASATANSYGVVGTGQAAGNGVLASVVNGGTGYALYVFGDTSAPVNASMHLEPLGAAPSKTPSAADEGDIYANSANNMLWYRDNSAYKAVHISQFGHAEGFDEDAASGSPVNSATEQAAAIAQANNKVTADLHVSGEVSIGGTAGELIEVKIRRGSGIGGTIIAQRDIYIPTTHAGPNSASVAIAGLDTSQAAGANTYTLTVRRGSGSNNIYWSTNTLVVRTLGE